MKNTVYGIILAALAASLSLASCSKEIEADPGNGGTPVADGVREFTLSFAAPAKSAPGTDWYHPVFSADDVIKVSNGTASENCTVTVSGTAAKIRTTLAGTLTAVYPSDAAVLSSGTTGHITGFKVSETQDGTFAAANICMAGNIAENATSITLENKTALFKVTPPSGVKAFTVTSLKAVVDGVARTGDAVAINSSDVVIANKTITVSNDTLTTFYVSLLPGAKLSDLSFEYVTDASHGAMKGIPEKDIQAQATALGKTFDAFNNLTDGNAYAIGSEGWHPYVTIGGKKWATMNLGATTVAGSYTTCCGDMYQWGSLNTLYTENGIQWSSGNGTTISWKSGKGSGFVLDNMEYTNFSASLPGDKDVVKQEWGSDWRMPTSQEFRDLYDACGGSYTSSSNPASVGQGVYWCSYDGVQGCLLCDGTNKLFFPAEGWGSGTQIKDVGSCGHCWATSTSGNYACYMRFTSGEFNWQYTGASSGVNYFGLTIRAVSDPGGFGFKSYTDNGEF